MTALARRTAFALDLCRRKYGYLVLDGEVTQTLVDAGLVTTRSVGDGFVIATAIPQPKVPKRDLDWHAARRFEMEARL